MAEQGIALEEPGIKISEQGNVHEQHVRGVELDVLFAPYAIDS